MTATIEITPLMLACQNENFDDVKSLLAKGVSVEETDPNQRTALFYCAENLETGCIDELLKAKANINHQDKDGYSCLHLAVICGNKLIVEYLIEHGADINATDSEMHSATHWCVVCGQDAILDYLLAHNADPETADIHGAYPIHYAAQMCGHIDVWDESINRDPSKSLIILKKLIQQKVKIDAEDFDQRNPIIWAASSGSSEALLQLYAAGGDPNKHEKDGLTALHCAASRNHLECIRALIEECKTSVDIMDNNNCTPIFYAATLGQLDACNLLIKYGSNLHVQDCKGRTVYHCAAAKGQLKCLKSLCKQNSNIWLRNRRGDYPIHEAYYNRQMECVYYLLDAISDKKAARSSNMYDGRTLVHLAAADDDLKLCKRLIDDGIDPNCLMKTSPTTYMTPYDVAVVKNSSECARYLKSLGGRTANEIVAKLKLNSHTESTKKGKNKLETSSSSDETPKTRRERLKSEERTSFNEADGDKQKRKEKKEGGGDKSSNDNGVKREVDDDNVEYTHTEESEDSNSEEEQDEESERKTRDHGGGGICGGGGDAVKINIIERQPPQPRRQQQHQQPNKRPIVEQRQTNKSNITESVEKQKKRDVVLAAQMAQAQAERERRNEQQQHKMTSLQAVYAQSKSKSTASRRKEKSSLENVAKPRKKPTAPVKQEKRNRNLDSKETTLLLLPNLNERDATSTKKNAQKEKPTEASNEEKQQQTRNESDTTTTTALTTANKEENNDESGEGVVVTKSSKYGARYDSSENDSSDNNDGENNNSTKKRSQAAVMSKSRSSSRPVAARTRRRGDKKGAVKPSPRTTNQRNDDDDSCDDDALSDEVATKTIHHHRLQHDKSDITSLTNERTPQKNTDTDSKTPRKRYLDLTSSSRTQQKANKSKLNSPATANTTNQSDENLVRLVIKHDPITSSSLLTRKRYSSLFDKQRLILKSLYEIRRSRINNRDIIISSDLNDMLIKSYDYDIRKDSRSLRDLEKLLEMIALDISDEYRKSNKRSQTLLAIKTRKSTLNTTATTGLNTSWRSTDNIPRSEERKRLNMKSQLNDSSAPTSENLRFRLERQQAQSDHLKIAYRSLLPNDIYKQYYNTNTKYSSPKEPPTTQKEKSIILPVISQKPSFTI